MSVATAFVQPLAAPQAAPALRGYVADAPLANMAPEPSSSSMANAAPLLLGAAAVVALGAGSKQKVSRRSRRAARVVRNAHPGVELEKLSEMLETVKAMTQPGKGILAMDESNKTCGMRLDSIGVENTEENRMRYRELLLGTKGLGDYCGGAILFEETLFQGTTDGKTMVGLCKENGVIPGIKVDTGLVPLTGGKPGENWCQGLDNLKARTDKFYEQGARFAKWRTTVRVRDHSELAVSEAAHGLAHYASICQSSGLVPIVEPEILLDGEHTIEETQVVFEKVWKEVFKALADQHVVFEAIYLKPSMVTPGADCPEKATPEVVAEKTLTSLKRRVPPGMPGIFFLSGGQSEAEATLNLNAMNQGPNPYHVSFSYARALQNSVLKIWAGKDENKVKAQAKLLQRAAANSKAQKGEYDPATADEDAMALEGMYVKDYAY